MPGGRTRFGPNHVVGPARSDQMGSVRMFRLSIWIKTVEWLTNVTRRSPPPIRSGGGGPGDTWFESFHAPGSRLKRQRTKSLNPWFGAGT